MPIDQRGDTTGLASGPSRNTTTSPHHCALRTVRRTVRSLSVIVLLALSTAVAFVVARHCRAPYSHKQGAIASSISIRASIERRTTPDDRGGRWRSTRRLTSSHMARDANEKRRRPWGCCGRERRPRPDASHRHPGAHGHCLTRDATIDSLAYPTTARGGDDAQRRPQRHERVPRFCRIVRSRPICAMISLHESPLLMREQDDGCFKDACGK